MMFLDSLFGSAITPAVTAGVGEVAMPALTDTAIQTAVPAMTDTALNPALNGLANSTFQTGVGTGLVDGAFMGAGKEGMFDALGSGIGGQALAGAEQVVDPAVTSGMFDSLGGFTNAMGSDQALNIAKIGMGGYNSYKQGQAVDNARRVQNRQLAMQEEAYGRNKSADERRQKLVF